jgi:putative phosphonate catabolism associated alcohol dehydrogenase
MKKKAAACIFYGANKPLELKDIEFPKLNNGELLVKNIICTICKSDLHTYSGARPGPVPSILGHEILGEIIELPKQPIYDFWNNKVKTGDLITWTIMASCGKCKYCKSGYPQKCISLKKYGHEKMDGHNKLTGGFASHTHLYPGTMIYKLPKNIDKKILAGLNCSWATVSAAMRLAGDVKGKKVLITGAGMLGLLTTIMCKENGASKIMVFEKDKIRLELTKKFGADQLISEFSQISSNQKKTKISSNLEPVDVIFEMTGSNEVVQLTFELADIGATIILAGSVFPVENMQINPEKVVRKLLQIKGIHNYTPEDLGEAILFLKKIYKKYPLELLFDNQSFGLNHVDKALNQASKSKYHRVVINF